MKLSFSDASLVDLESISDWIAKENPDRARSFVRELQASCVGILQYPEKHPLIELLPDKKMRRKVYGSYLIFYVVLKQGVTISRILHGSRYLEDIDFPLN